MSRSLNSCSVPLKAQWLVGAYDFVGHRHRCDGSWASSVSLRLSFPASDVLSRLSSQVLVVVDEPTSLQASVSVSRESTWAQATMKHTQKRHVIRKSTSDQQLRSWAQRVKKKESKKTESRVHMFSKNVQIGFRTETSECRWHESATVMWMSNRIVAEADPSLRRSACCLSQCTYSWALATMNV